MYRAFTKKIVYKLQMNQETAYAAAERLFNTKISWEPLLSIRCAKNKCRTAEIAGDEPLRIGGIRKLQTLKWGAAYLYQVFYERFVR